MTTRGRLALALGAAIYLAGARLIFRAAATEFLDLIRSSIGRRRS